MVKKKSTKPKTKPKTKRKLSRRAQRRATVLKLVQHIEGEDKGARAILRMAHQAMLMVQQEETAQRRDKWSDRLKEAVTPSLETILKQGSRGEQLQAGHLAARLIDSVGEHQVQGKRFEYGAMVVETLGSMDLGKLQAQVDSGGEEVTSERWLRVLADLKPVFAEAIAEHLEAAKK